MKSDSLHVLLSGNLIGMLQRAGGRSRFTYSDAWRQDARAFPLSLSMPLTAAEHGAGAVEAFIWGLLPDNDQIIDRWAKAFHVSPRNAHALLSNVGEDCAGAVQFVRSERLAEATASGPVTVEWLTEADVAERLKDLRSDQAAWRRSSDLGHFSLAGAQPKTALLQLDGRWGIPAGRTPTTHILKPPLAGLQGHAENEHFCLVLAKELGLPAVRSQVQHFGDEVAIVVERYDRLIEAASALVPIFRLHQEDLCQALGVLPTSKYQNEGGPSPVDVVRLLRTHSNSAAEDVETFVAALVFNWLIAGPDAHAKNYSLLHGFGGRVRLAPLYDLASVLLYDSFDQRRVKLAMKIGGTHQLDDIGPRQWRKLAAELGIETGKLLDKVMDFASAMPDAASATRRHLTSQGLTHPIIDGLGQRLAERAQLCLQAMRL